jgi:hypothetical protein
LLAGVDQREDLDRGVSDAVDQDVVGMDHRFAGARDAARAVEGRMIGQAIGGVLDCRVQASGRWFVAGTDIVEDVEQVGPGLVIPDDRQRHLYFVEDRLRFRHHLGVWDWRLGGGERLFHLGADPCVMRLGPFGRREFGLDGRELGHAWEYSVDGGLGKERGLNKCPWNCVETEHPLTAASGNLTLIQIELDRGGVIADHRSDRH